MPVHRPGLLLLLQRYFTKAWRDLSDSLVTLYVFVSMHGVLAKPRNTFARHTLSPENA